MLYAHPGDLSGDLHALAHFTDDNAAADTMRRCAEAMRQAAAALHIAIVQLGEPKDGMGAAHYHAVNIARRALSALEGRTP